MPAGMGRTLCLPGHIYPPGDRDWFKGRFINKGWAWPPASME